MSKRPIILAFSTAYFPFTGGAEIALREIARRLSHTYDFRIITAQFDPALPKIEKVQEGTIYRNGLGAAVDKWLLPLSVFRSDRSLHSPIINKSKNMLIWGMDITQGSIAATLMKLRHPGFPYLLTIQYGGGEDRIDQARGGLIARSLRWMLTKADHVVSISSYLMNLANDYGYSSPATLIPNGVDLTRFSPQRHSGPKPPTKIISTSRLVQKNGIDILIRAIKLLQSDYPDIVCEIVGDGDELENLTRLANNLGIQRNVNFLGFIPYEGIPQALWKADIFVRPSRSEGMGNAFIEALAAGLPIIGTPVGGIPDIIEDRKTGLFVNPEDPSDVAEKIRLLVSKPSLAVEIVRNGRELVADRFSWDRISGEYDALFSELLDQ